MFAKTIHSPKNISLSTGKAVGYSAFGNKDQDAQWSQRTDWDIAVCGEYIRTNGGTSGVGNAALGVSKVPYDITSRIEVTADVDTIEVWDD